MSKGDVMYKRRSGAQGLQKCFRMWVILACFFGGGYGLWGCDALDQKSYTQSNP